MKYDLTELKAIDQVTKASSKTNTVIKTFYELDKDTIIIHYESKARNLEYQMVIDRLVYDTRKELIRNVFVHIDKKNVQILVPISEKPRKYGSLSKIIYELYNTGVKVTSRVKIKDGDKFNLRYDNLKYDVNHKTSRVYVEMPKLLDYEMLSVKKRHLGRGYDIFYHKYNDKGDVLITMFNSYTKIAVQTLISECDYERCKDLRIMPHWDQATKGYYIEISKSSEGTEHTRFHRFILDITDPKKEVDHENLDSRDNRRENIRVVSRVENIRNRGIQKSNTTGVNGVIYLKSQNYYMAAIKVNSKPYKKIYSIKLYGDKLAFAKACAQRWEWEKEFGYREKSTKEER